jgi:F-type H+-transporting ATPase subunit epsilon
MAKSFQVEVVTPDATVLSMPAVSLQAPAWEGYLGVLAGHAPLLCVLRAGVLTVRGEAKAEHMALRGGFMEVQPERVIVLADAVERASEVDVAAAEKALAAGREPLPAPEGATAEARQKARTEAAEAREDAVRWAEARLAAADRARSAH